MAGFYNLVQKLRNEEIGDLCSYAIADGLILTEIKECENDSKRLRKLKKTPSIHRTGRKDKTSSAHH